jgi:urease accessory protein
MHKKHVILISLLTFLMFSTACFAHSDAGDGSGFVSGFFHPIMGWDHVIAMVAVGIWGAFLGRTAIWVLPIIFPMVMAFGGALGVIGVELPYVEVGIALSAVVLGLMIAFAVNPPLQLAAIIVAVFAIFHGHAHGTELPGAASPVAYSLGFVLATGLLHLSGIAFGFIDRVPNGKRLIQGAGVVIAALGGFFLSSAV